MNGSRMNAEYQRLEAEASEVQNQLDGLVTSGGQMVAAKLAKSQPPTFHSQWSTEPRRYFLNIFPCHLLQ